MLNIYRTPGGVCKKYKLHNNNKKRDMFGVKGFFFKPLNKAMLTVE